MLARLLIFTLEVNSSLELEYVSVLMPLTLQFNGMNVLQSREVAKYAVNYAKTVGPILLEAKTYR